MALELGAARNLILFPGILNTLLGTHLTTEFHLIASPQHWMILVRYYQMESAECDMFSLQQVATINPSEWLRAKGLRKPPQKEEEPVI